ncbi:terminase small subunit [Bacillus nitratireducens]|uniref:terminase small subunit n=1 Tax=Bacillus nitratireducens TaxID=2026193 RepID=UPI0011A9774F|nr:terminase small subunit [Bacillus nitratireducens]
MKKSELDELLPFKGDEEIQIVTQSASHSDNLRAGMVTIPLELSARVPIKAQNFLANLIKTNMNVSKASEMSGFTEGYGRKLMNKPECRQYFTALSNRDSFYDIMSFNEVLATLTSIARADDSQKDDMLNVKTGEVHQLKVPSNTRVKALENLSKYHKILFNGPNIDTLQANQTIIVDIEGDDLEKIEARERKTLKEHNSKEGDIIEITIED